MPFDQTGNLGALSSKSRGFEPRWIPKEKIASTLRFSAIIFERLQICPPSTEKTTTNNPRRQPQPKQPPKNVTNHNVSKFLPKPVHTIKRRVALLNPMGLGVLCSCQRRTLFPCTSPSTATKNVYGTTYTMLSGVAWVWIEVVVGGWCFCFWVWGGYFFVFQWTSRTNR